MKVNRLLPVLLLAAMAMPAYAQDDSGLWLMLEQVESLSDALLLGQDALPGAAVPGENQLRSSADNALGAGPSSMAIVGGTFGKAMSGRRRSPGPAPAASSS
jgi:hypothetical protein